jgi:hypothetical protein
MFCEKCGVRFEQESNTAPQHEEIKPSITKIITKIVLTVLLCVFGTVAFIALSALLMLRQINITELINLESLPQLESILLMLLTNYAMIASVVLCVIYLFNLFLLYKKNIKIFLLSNGITLALVGLIYFAISLYIDQFSGIFAEIEQYINIFSDLVPYLIILELILIVLGGILLVSFFLIKSKKKNKPIKSTTPKVKSIWFNTGVITNGALSVTILMCMLLFFLNPESITENDTVYDDSPTVIEVLDYVYRNDVEVIESAPEYSIEENNGIYTIYVNNPNNTIRDLSVGDTFVFEPTTQNPGGIAGHVTNILRSDTSIMISARAPETLDEIFEEFEFVGDINLLADAGEITLADELKDIEGVEIFRNPTRLLEARFDNVVISGINLSGRVRIMTPRVNASIDKDNVNHFILTTGSEINITASTERDFGRTIPLFVIPISVKGVTVEIPIGFSITAEGNGEIVLYCRIDSQFGIRENTPVSHINTTHNIEYSFDAKVEATVYIQAKASVFLIPVYGIYSDLGVGARTNTTMQERCTDDTCFVFGVYNIWRISSIDDFGIAKYIPALRFGLRLTSDNITNYRYLSRAGWYDACPHDENYQPPEIFIDQPTEIFDFSVLGEPVTLAEAKNTHGLYIKEDDLFYFIAPQWTYSALGGFNQESRVATRTAQSALGINFNSPAASVYFPILLNEDFEIPRLPNNANYVLVGLTDLNIYKPAYTGWTIPIGLSMWDETVENPGGWYLEPKYQMHDFNHNGSPIKRNIELINGASPSVHVSRMIYTGYQYLLHASDGIIDANQGEEFTLRFPESARLDDITLVADKRFFVLPTDEFSDSRADYFVSGFDDDYLEVVFFTPPVGIYAVGRGVDRGLFFNMIVEFISP